jgi:hypothetical protein
VFQKRVFQGQGEESGRYACAALFNGFEVKDNRTVIKVPASWSPKDQEKWKALIAACNKVSIEAFKKPMSELDRSVYKLPFHRGEDKEYAGYGPGVVYTTMSAKKVKPNVVGADIDETTGKLRLLGPDDFYPGCWARASVTPFAFTNIGKGIALGLNSLQKLKEGERLDNVRSADEDFGSDPAEFEAEVEADAGGKEEAADFE